MSKTCVLFASDFHLLGMETDKTQLLGWLSLSPVFSPFCCNGLDRFLRRLLVDHLAEVENVAEAAVAWRVGVQKSDNPSISHMYSLQMFMLGSHEVVSLGFRQSCFMFLCDMEKGKRVA